MTDQTDSQTTSTSFDNKLLWINLWDSDWWRLNSPTFVGATLYMLVIAILWWEWIPYLSDICNPSTLAEAGGWQYSLSTGWHTTVLVIASALIVLVFPSRWGVVSAVGVFVLALLPLGGDFDYHIPWTWIVVPLLILWWRYLLHLLFLLNQEEVKRRFRIIELSKKQNLDDTEFKEAEDLSSENGTLRLLKPLSSESPGSGNVCDWLRGRFIDRPLQWISRRRTRERRFCCWFFFLSVRMSCPAWGALFLLHSFPGTFVNDTLMAVIGLLCLLGLLSLMLTLFRLGTLTGVRLWALWLAATPLLIFTVTLFNLNPYERGQATLNKAQLGWLNTYTVADRKADEDWAKKQEKTPFFLFDSEAIKKTEKTEKEGRPLVFFCVSGGGTRAALFAAGIYCRMWDEGKSGQLLLDQVDVISSVSGGSLASAYLTEALYRKMSSSDAPMTRHQALESFFTDFTANPPRPEVTWYGKKYPAARVNSLSTLAGEFTERVRKDPNALKKFDTNPYLNAMRQNFVAPIISGYLWPLTGRGPSYENTWERLFDWCDKQGSPRRLSHFYDSERVGQLPVMIFNSVLTRNGSRVAITHLHQDNFAPLEKFGPPVNPFGERNSAVASRYDPKPERILTLNALAPGWDIPLKQAVRASANFPAALPVMRFEQTTGEGFTPHRIWEMQDGGVLNNSGTDAVLALLRQYHAKQGASLRRRGVLIFQIDANYLPLKEGGIFRLPHNLEQTQSTRWLTEQNNTAARDSLYLRELALLFNYPVDELEPIPATVDHEKYTVGYVTQPEKQSKGSRGFAYFKVRLGETANDRVLTYWHLNDRERKNLYNGLCASQQGEAIRGAGNWLKDPYRFLHERNTQQKRGY